jgi:serine protease
VNRHVLFVALLLAVGGGAPDAVIAASAVQIKKPVSTLNEPMVGQLMVKLHQPTATERVQKLGAARVTALSKSAGMALESVRPMSGDATVMRLPTAMPLSQAQAVIDRLRADPNVEWAEPDLPVRRLQTQVPVDQGFATLQWNLFGPTQIFQSAVSSGGTKDFTASGGANLPTAWARSVGSAAITVAVIDTGVVTNHRDLNGRLLPGYDFISSNALDFLGAPANFVANDGDGRDADPSDPGDWVTDSEEALYPNACADSASPSSWHGTHMAGIIAAQWGNDVSAATGQLRAGTRTAGMAPGVRILPIRALGKCGGVQSDVIDGMRWAAGVSVTGVPNNANPARVLNLSLGGSSGSCGAAYQSAVNDVIARGVVVVAASGNEAALGVLQPANCQNVIGVTAHVINGDNADYSNVGPQVAVSAPGGGLPSVLEQINPPLTSSDNAFVIWSTGMFGATTPTSTVSSTDGRSGDALLGLTGTSPATPHVAAAAALLLSIDPTLTVAEVRALITGNTRPHPVGGYCLTQQGFGNCGTGLLDVGRAVSALLPVAPAVPPSPPALPPEPVPPPPPSGGGGSLPLWPLLLLGALSLAREVRRRR